MTDIPPLNRQGSIVNRNGTPSNSFAIYWQNVIKAIQKQIADIIAVNNEQTNLLNQILEAQATANAANAALNSMNSGFPSGTSGPFAFGVSSTSWLTIGTVSLTGVTAGTLRFDTTRLLINGFATTVTDGPLAADYQIAEELTGGGPVSVCLSGTWTAEQVAGDPAEIVFPFATVDAARPTIVNTGAVTYRLQVRRSSGIAVLAGARAIFRAAQAS